MIWLVMIACGLLTFATRFVMFSGLAPRRLPDWLEDALGFVPIAVLTAIIVPAVINRSRRHPFHCRKFAPSSRRNRGIGGVAHPFGAGNNRDRARGAMVS